MTQNYSIAEKVAKTLIRFAGGKAVDKLKEFVDKPQKLMSGIRFQAMAAMGLGTVALLGGLGLSGFMMIMGGGTLTVIGASIAATVLCVGGAVGMAAGFGVLVATSFMGRVVSNTLNKMWSEVETKVAPEVFTAVLDISAKAGFNVKTLAPVNAEPAAAPKIAAELKA